MNWSNWINRKVYLRLNNVLPKLLKKTCELCLEANHDVLFICSDCEDALPQVINRCLICAIPLARQEYCGQCLSNHPAFDYSHSSFNYAPPIDTWLHRLKNKHQTAWAQKLASLMLNAPPCNLHEIDAFTFVPSTRWSLIKRGFNPAELIARELARKLNKPIIAQLVKRSHGSEQKELNRQQRITNVSQHFYATSKKLNGEHMLLIEDVMTTGSTAHTMASILKESGASKVGIWCLARTPKH